MSKPIAIIFGAGKNIGASAAKAFSSKGFRVAQAARSLDSANNDDDNLHLKVDLAQSGSVSSAFGSVRKAWGEPSVVVYNAAAAHFADASNPFTVTEEDFANDITVNTTSAYAAVKEAVASFQSLPDSTPKAFFYTGNKLSTPGFIMPALATLGVGKSATSHIIDVAANVYKDSSFRFYYVDERVPDGGPNYKVNGDAHADFFLSLLEDGKDVPWHASFVKGQGYTKF